MPITANRGFFRRQRQFGTRPTFFPILAPTWRALRRRLRRISDRAIFIDVCDDRLNPFLFIAGSCR